MDKSYASDRFQSVLMVMLTPAWPYGPLSDHLMLIVANGLTHQDDFDAYEYKENNEYKQPISVGIHIVVIKYHLNEFTSMM